MIKVNSFAEIQDHLKQRKGVSKFHLIVGNPPYQDSSNKAKNNKLWHKFIRKSTELVDDTGTIAMVTPSSILNDTVGFGKWFKHELLPNQYHLLKATLHREVKHFDVGVETCDWIITRDLTQPEIPFPEYRDPIITAIVDKVRVYPDKMPLAIENAHITKDDFGKGTTEIYYSGKNKTTVDVTVENTGKLKIVFPFSAAYHSQFITTEPTAHFNRVYYVESEEHANNIQSFTLSKLYKFYAQHFQKTSGFTPAVKNSQLPLLDTSRAWTDSEIYQHFGLTQEEIDFVEVDTQ